MVYTYRSAPPAIRFDWDAEEHTTGYRFSIASDRDFHNVVHDERISDSEFTHGNLREGRYYWRVASLIDEAEGAPSPPRRLDTKLDSEPPALDVAFPQHVVQTERITLRGTTEPGTRVFIREWSDTVDDSGKFEHELSLAPGVNLVVVEAMDDAGNFAYRSEIVNARFLPSRAGLPHEPPMPGARGQRQPDQHAVPDDPDRDVRGPVALQERIVHQ